jgi:hypothetical protein
LNKWNRNFIDLKGKRFGKLIVLERVPPPPRMKKQNAVYWLCECDCGKTKIILGISLRKGLTKSCGCIGKKYAWCYTGIEL